MKMLNALYVLKNELSQKRETKNDTGLVKKRNRKSKTIDQKKL